MQEKRNKRLAFLLLVLVSASVAVYWFGRGENSFTPDKHLFNDYDLQSINEVLLESPQGKVRLHYTNSRWQVNDMPADPNLIQVLFATLQQAEPKRPVASSINDSISAFLEKQGVKVSLLSGQQAVETFYAGGNLRKTQAYFKKAGNDESHVMTIPGYRVYVSGIFELDALGWRDKLVFNFNWQNFKSLEISSQKSEGNFTVVMGDREVTIKGIAEADTARLNAYLDHVSLLTVDEYVANSGQNLDSLARIPPVLAIRINDVANREYTLQLYPRAGKKSFYGWINASQWAVFHENKIIPILRSKEFFIKR